MRASLFAASLLAAGCGGNDRLPVYPLPGKVTAGGQPAPGAVVVFHPLAKDDRLKDLRPYAKVGPDGAFRLSTYAPDDGVPAGEFAVTVEWREGRRRGTAGPEADPRKPELLGGRYLDPARTPLRVTVTPGMTELPPLAVERR